MGEPVDKNLWGELEPEEGVLICQALLTKSLMVL